MKRRVPVGTSWAVCALLVAGVFALRPLPVRSHPLGPEAAEGAAEDTLRVHGLDRPVRLVRDRWGVVHIYARTEHDLFFAQGYNAARDRLFQLEIWRRRATGTIAEILGPRELKRDIGARLFRFRGDLREELTRYHPRGPAIVRAFVDGVNAYIAETERRPALLPLEFELLGIRPGRWTPEIVVSRHQGLLWNVEEELNAGRAVALLGPEKVKHLSYFHPGDPDIALDPRVDGSLLGDDILKLYTAFHSPVRFRPRDVVAAHRARASPQSGSGPETGESGESTEPGGWAPSPRLNRSAVGSNNWVVRGARTLGGNPIMANDPHRVQQAPSLRYMVHLVGPGWNVAGGGEPEIPGVSIGHNPHGAWGLTVFLTDAEDLYVYETDPAHPTRYRYGSGWEEMTVVRDEVAVKGQPPVRVELKYTRHGPVVYEDSAHHKAYAVRAAWLEPGGAPYLASLRMDQASSWEEFRDACTYSNIPGENMVWADTAGNIGWQAVGIAPIRPNWSGLVPVPGDGRYEWSGFLPIAEKPHVYNPDQGFWATANEDLIPAGYPHRDAVGWTWSDPFRKARIVEVLGTGRRHTLADMMALQTDYVSIPARSLVPFLDGLKVPDDPTVEWARRVLLEWDFVLSPASVAAGIYEAWQGRVVEEITGRAVPEKARPYLTPLSMKKILDWIAVPPPWFGEDPVARRDTLLVKSLRGAVSSLRERFGSDVSEWRYGQPGYKHVLLHHPLSRAVDDATRAVLEVGPFPRGGDAWTVNNTGRADNQATGPSFRMIAEVGEWDHTMVTNTPGQVGDPASPHYRDLFESWARDRYFPLYYSAPAIRAVAEQVTVLAPEP